LTPETEIKTPERSFIGTFFSISNERHRASGHSPGQTALSRLGSDQMIGTHPDRRLME